MLETMPTLLALDFDGVICDGLVEYFQTAWRAYCQIWKPASETPPDDLAPQFYRLRPVVETGWEMPLVLRSLLLGHSEADILQNWAAIAQKQVDVEKLIPAEMGATVDCIRDEWIAADLETWLTQHRFYPGVIARLQQTLASPVDVVIITTKEGRFVRQLLQQQGIELAESQIFGKERRQPKAQSLRDLIHAANQSEPPLHIWFVEDRLKTLQSIKAQPDLTEVRLFLGDWGYNTPEERDAAQQDSHITLLSLEQFAQEFTVWREV